LSKQKVEVRGGSKETGALKRPEEIFQNQGEKILQ
jgi:hypothetical protein